MPDRFHLRPPQPDEAAEAIALQLEAFEPLTRQTWGRWDRDAARAGMLAEWRPAQTRCVVVSQRLAGWVRLERRAGYDWLDLIVVGADFRGRGLGGAVLARLMAEATDRGVPLWLSVYRSNPARRLYGRLGFVTVERDAVRVLMGHGGQVPPAEIRGAGPDRS